MTNLKLAFRTLFKTPFVTIVAVLSLALGIGANAAIFSLFDQMLLRPIPVRATPGAWSTSARRGRTGLAVVRPGRRLRRGVQLPDVPRPREGATRASAGSPRTATSARTSRIKDQTLNTDGHARFGVVLLRARARARARPAVHPEGRPDHRRSLRRRAELRVLGDEARRRPERRQSAESSSTARR